MPKKHIFSSLAILFTLAASHATAQQYTITAKYSLLSIYLSAYGGELSFDRIDTAQNYTFIIDMNNKTASDPAIVSPAEIIPITEIIHDEHNHSYILKYKTDRRHRWNYYKLQLSADDEPLYLQKVENSKSSNSARDTFFNTYTNDLTSLSFSKKYTRIKDTLFENGYGTDEQLKGLSKVSFRKTNEPIEMRNGYVNWTREGITHHLLISRVDLVKQEGSDGIALRCAENNDEYYEMTYMDSDRKIDTQQYGKDRYVIIVKYVGGKRIWAGILR